MTSKRIMANDVADSGSNDSQERQHIFAWQMSRTEAQVAESWHRLQTINAVTQAEINAHCDLRGLLF